MEIVEARDGINVVDEIGMGKVGAIKVRLEPCPAD